MSIRAPLVSNQSMLDAIFP